MGSSIFNICISNSIEKENFCPELLYSWWYFVFMIYKKLSPRIELHPIPGDISCSKIPENSETTGVYRLPRPA